VIGFEYVRAMATAAAAMLGPSKLGGGGIPDVPRPRPSCHVLCVGQGPTVIIAHHIIHPSHLKLVAKISSIL